MTQNGNRKMLQSLFDAMGNPAHPPTTEEIIRAMELCYEGGRIDGELAAKLEALGLPSEQAQAYVSGTATNG